MNIQMLNDIIIGNGRAMRKTIEKEASSLHVIKIYVVGF